MCIILLILEVDIRNINIYVINCIKFSSVELFLTGQSEE